MEYHRLLRGTAAHGPEAHVTQYLSLRAISIRLPPMRTHYNAADLNRMIDTLVSDIVAAFPPSAGPITVVGIRTRGEILAQRLVDRLEVHGHRDIGRGVLDITLYRDDLSEIGPRPMVRPTRIETDINSRPLILV